MVFNDSIRFIRRIKESNKILKSINKGINTIKKWGERILTENVQSKVVDIVRKVLCHKRKLGNVAIR